jgi:hypothetical protein
MKIPSFIASASLLIALFGSPIHAATIQFDWIGDNQFLSGDVLDYPNYDGYPLEAGPYAASFVFDVAAFSGESFTYSGHFLNNLDAALINPYNATLVSRPDGHLGGYFAGEYNLKFENGDVSVSATLSDYDDYLYLSSNSIGDDHNQGFFHYGSIGYWTASVDGNTVADSQVSAVPLPSSASLLLLAGLSFLYLGRRKIV